MDPTRKKHLLTQTSDACSSMIVGINQLRLSVLDLFTTLADNGPDPSKNPHSPYQENLLMGNLGSSSTSKLYHQQTLSNLATSHTLCTSSTPSIIVQQQQEQEQQQALIQYVNQSISSIMTIIRSLDQDIMILMQNNTLINPGESVSLGMDCSVDKHNLYMDLCKSYKTFTKLTEYSGLCYALLHQQSLKRVHKRIELPSSASVGVAGSNASGANFQTKDARSESIVATFNPYIYKNSFSKTSVMNVLEQCLKGHELMKGVYSQPFGVSTEVFQVSVNRVLKAILVMRGIVIDVVIVKAYHESFSRKATRGSSASLVAESGGGSPFVEQEDDIDLWSESKYAVFRKLTHHANAAVLHFQYPTYPEIAVRSFLSWFNSYSDLFAATCSRCNSRLRKFMPPICRDFSTGFSPHHDSCK